MRRPRTGPIFHVHGVNDRNGPRLRVRSGETAELDAIRAVAPGFQEIQVTFAHGQHEKACSMLMSLVLSFGISDRPSTHLRMVEAAQVIRRVRNNFGEPWGRDEPGYRELVDLKAAYLLSDDVALAVLLDPLGYAHRDFFLPGRAPYTTDEILRHPLPSPDHGLIRGTFRPGHDETDVQIRCKRLRALAKEYGADNNLPQSQLNILFARADQWIDDDEPRFGIFCCE